MIMQSILLQPLINQSIPIPVETFLSLAASIEKW